MSPLAKLQFPEGDRGKDGGRVRGKGASVVRKMETWNFKEFFRSFILCGLGQIT